MAETPGWLYGPLVLVLDEADIGVRALGLLLLSVQASGSVPELSLERLLDLITKEVPPMPNIISVPSLDSWMATRMWWQ